MFETGRKYRIRHKDGTWIEGIVYNEDKDMIDVTCTRKPVSGVHWKKENIVTFQLLDEETPVINEKPEEHPLEEIMVAAEQKRKRIEKAIAMYNEKLFEAERALLYRYICELQPVGFKYMCTNYHERLIEEFKHPNLVLTWEPVNARLKIEITKKE